VNWIKDNLEYAEFLGWLKFLDWEFRQQEKQDYYLAQIACMLSGSKKAKINDFLLKFRGKKEDVKAIKIEPKEQILIFKKIFGIKN
jgi:hypothetical protein